LTKVNIALCQIQVSRDKQNNLTKALEMIAQAASQGAEIVMLPEMFNCPYDHQYFRPYAERLPGGETEKKLSEAAKKAGIYLIGGSIPELSSDESVYNLSLIFDSKGNVIAKHRKVHLFDIQVKDGIQFQESATLSAGDQVTVVDTPWGKIGVVICYDIRFPELTRLMTMEGAKIIFVPAAFNMTTGPAHWELLFRSRALDNEVFMVGCSPARDLQSSYVAYGHSLVTNPWGKVVGELGDGEGILNVTLDLDEIDQVRQSIPIWQHRREDIYTLARKN
jgi:omega-amidase